LPVFVRLDDGRRFSVGDEKASVQRLVSQGVLTP
jgi:hypothetical protein